ncbi:hypothetical protein DITRI_Ditri13aG0060300 [Diplodiscus trichospermus]
MHVSSKTMQRFPSMDNIIRKGITKNGNGFSPHSRRIALWGSGSFEDALSPSKAEIRPFGEALGMPTSLFTTGPKNGNGCDELHEVEL